MMQCSECQQSFEPARSDAKVCSNKCRQARFRRLHRKPASRQQAQSVRSAAIAAGIVTPPTVLDQLLQLWEKALPDEREQFVRAVNAPRGNLHSIYRGFEIRQVDGTFIVEFEGFEIELPSVPAARQRIDKLAAAILRKAY